MEECLLNKIFDKIFVIHCIENEPRLKNIQFQKEQSGLNLEIHETCYFPWSQQAVNGLILSNRGRSVINGSEFNLTREFYSIIKRSYLKGLKRILIFEDDFSLMKNEVLNEFLENIPEDFDIIQFSLLLTEEIYDFENIANEYEKGVYFTKTPFGAWSNNGLALSRKGMEYFISRIDKEFMAADYPIFESANKFDFYGKKDQGKLFGLNHYIPTIPLVFLDKRFDSQVQQESKKDLYKIYNYLNRSYYNLIYDTKINSNNI